MGHSYRRYFSATFLQDILVGHSCGTLSRSNLVGHSWRLHSCGITFVGHFYRALLWDTVVNHFCRTLLRDILVGYFCALTGHSCGIPLCDTFVGYFCETALQDTPVVHFYRIGTILRDTFMGHSYRTLLWDILTGHSSASLLWDTFTEQFRGTLFEDTLDAYTLILHSCGTLL